VDAAILFADLLLPFEPMGAPFEFQAGEGPVVLHPVRTHADVEHLRVFEAEEGLAYVMTAIRGLRQELDGKKPLIGFAGAPFTLASYLIEGGKSSNYIHTKQMMYGQPELWHQLAAKLAEVVRRYLRAQIAAGAQAVQVFDSWVGALSPEDYATFVEPHVHHVLADLVQTGVPVIHFGTATHSLLELQKRAGGTVIGIDWRTPIEEARRRLGSGVALQGNLDPILLFAPREELGRRASDLLHRAGKLGYVFNLGHGILPQTDPDQVRFLCDWVHEHTS
jgi:uroporphyrinogen decarboxylase